jgi:hypothetical protein
MSDFEIEIAQSTTLGATSLWQVAELHQETAARPVELPKLLLVLPIVFHTASAIAIARVQFASGFLKAIDDQPLIVVGLQDRLQASWMRSLRSLTLAVGAGLLNRIDPEGDWPMFESTRRSLPESLRPTTDRERAVLGASRRLGHSFAMSNPAQVAQLLGVRF